MWKYIYSTNVHLIINIEDYNKGEEIGEIKKKTTNEWWFRNLYATKLDKGTKVYSGEMEYRKGDRPFQIVIEEDEEIVFIKFW